MQEKIFRENTIANNKKFCGEARDAQARLSHFIECEIGDIEGAHDRYHNLLQLAQPTFDQLAENNDAIGKSRDGGTMKTSGISHEENMKQLHDCPMKEKCDFDKKS